MGILRLRTSFGDCEGEASGCCRSLCELQSMFPKSVMDRGPYQGMHSDYAKLRTPYGHPS